VVFGTRPEAIKLAPVIRALQKSKGDFQLQIWVTGQHRQMLDQVLEIFDITPDLDLDLMTFTQDLSDVHSSVLISIRNQFQLERPDLVLVHGDTTTSMAASQAAFFAGIPVGHIEAGLRTFNLHAPFPEEFNRQVIGKIADLHFAPTQQCKENLIREGVDPNSIWVTGNTVIDALNLTLNTINSDEALERQIDSYMMDLLGFNYRDSKYILITGHRRENFGQGIIDICNSIGELAKTYPDWHFVYPVHLNPNVQKPVNEIIGNVPNIHLIAPQDYVHFIALLANCQLVLTDSGGIQEEAPSLGKPVLVMRDTTERPEAVLAGTVKLVGTDKAMIIREVSHLIQDKDYYSTMATAHNPYGDGTSSEQIVAVLREWV
jgi:UDP-N-acetylglucosamine 2-epimerase (non-hydrolysing)